MKKIQDKSNKKNQKDKAKTRKKNAKKSRSQLYADSMKIVLEKEAKQDWALINAKEKDFKAQKKLNKEKIKTKEKAAREVNKKPKKLSEEEKIEAIKEKIKKDRKKQQSIIADANKTLTAKRRIAETKAEIKQKELAARAKKKALKIAAKKLEAQQEESASKINQKNKLLLLLYFL